MREPQEIQDEEYEQILERVCAIDVAKASGKVCTRVPHPSRPGARRTRVQDVDATTNAILELGGYLVGEGIEKVTLESTLGYPGCKCDEIGHCPGRAVAYASATAAAGRAVGCLSLIRGTAALEAAGRDDGAA